jgi:hypothetical protein
VVLTVRLVASVPGFGHTGLQAAEEFGPPGVDGRGERSRSGTAARAPGFKKRISRWATSCRCPPHWAVDSRTRSSSLAIHAARLWSVGSPASPFHVRWLPVA